MKRKLENINDFFNEIRKIDGIKYKVDKYPCTCSCHRNPGMVHFVACCNNGYLEYLEKIK